MGSSSLFYVKPDGELKAFTPEWALKYGSVVRDTSFDSDYTESLRWAYDWAVRLTRLVSG